MSFKLWMEVSTDKTTGRQSFGPNFPVNPKIWEGDVQVNYEGQPLTLHVVWGRGENSFKRLKTIPRYKVEIYLDGDLIRDKQMDPPEGSKWTKNGPNYNEDKLVEDYNQKIIDTSNDSKMKMYVAIKKALNRKQHEPELADALRKIGEYDDKTDWSASLPNRSIHISEQGYEGDYPIKVSPNYYSATHDFSITLYTDLEHKLAPRPAYLERITVPSSVHNWKEVNELVDKKINENHEQIVNDYLKYLKSFAFTQTQQEQANVDIKPIIDMITSNHVDIGKIKEQLLKRQFIRASKRQKQMGQGMVAQGTFQLIIDDAAIRKATFIRGGDNSPDYFYVAIAYNLMRIKHGNIGFMPILLDDAYRSVANMIHRFYSKEISTKQVAQFINDAARTVYTDVTGRQYKSWDDVYSDFYSGGSGVNKSHIENSAIQAFGLFIQSLNLGITAQQATEKPKMVYRQLAHKLHPDTTPFQDKEDASEKFKELADLYSKLPSTMIESILFTNFKTWMEIFKL